MTILLLGLLGCLGCSAAALQGRLGQPAERPCVCATPGQDLAAGDAAALCLTLAHQVEQEGLEAEAARQYELARHYQPEVDVAHRLAVLYDHLGSPALASAEYERAVEAHPNDADLLNDLGYSHYTHGQWAVAEQYLRRAVENNPQHQRAWSNLGMVLAQQGRTRESLEAFQHSVSPAEAQYNVGFLLAERGKTGEARAAYCEALRLQPDLAAAQLALAKLEGPATPSAVAPAQDGKATNVLPVPPGDGPVAVRPASAAKEAGAAAVVVASTHPPSEPSQAGAPDRVPALPWDIPAGMEPDALKAEPKSAGESANRGTIEWVPPPPVPQHRLPPELVRCKPAGAHAEDKATPSTTHADHDPAAPTGSSNETLPELTPPPAPPMPAGAMLPWAETSPKP
jgi:Tfp pilus assembly protein PilF